MRAKPIAFITGITGQDGGYLAEHLLKLNYIVVGMKRRTSQKNQPVIQELLKNGNFSIEEGDMTDAVSLRYLLNAIRPDEIYNLAAQSYVGASWSQPLLTSAVNYLGVLNLLEAVRDMNDYHPRIYQASTSEMFGNQYSPQNENTAMMPRSPYGVSKLAAHRLCGCYRDSFGMFISCGILFNHESPRRGEEFVTRKIAMGVAAIVMGKADYLTLGSLDAKRDWGYAPDYVRAMWLMLQQDEPNDFVIATGQTHKIIDFVRESFNAALTYHAKEWRASGLAIKSSIDDSDVRSYIRHDKKLTRPAEIFELRGDPTNANRDLGWYPTLDFQGLVKVMLDSELKKASREGTTVEKKTTKGK